MIFQNALRDFLENNISRANYVTPNRIPTANEITDRKSEDKYLVHQKIDGTSPVALDGPTYVYEETYQIDAYAHRKIDAQRIMEQVKSKLHGYFGEMGDFQVSNITIESYEDGYEEDTGLYREEIDLTIYYSYKGVKINE